MSVDSEHAALFFKAVKDNDLDTVDEMLRSRRISADARNDPERNETALHIAANRGYNKLAQLLVDKYEADVNALDAHGEIPLQVAKDNYNAKLCKFLIERKSNKAEYAKGLLNAEEVDALFEAAKANNVKKVCDLIDTKAVDVNSLDKGEYSCTALHVAAKNGFEELSRILVDKYQANVNIMDEIGDRPIHTAAQNDHTAIVKFLKERNSKDTEDVEHYEK